ncbi:unnamed protein product [Amoebophrya sp. A120]|nr:unnamed protein product [Amoebophrya sp. A120]|eukprot:GSA120T00006835001.1
MAGSSRRMSRSSSMLAAFVSLFVGTAMMLTDGGFGGAGVFPSSLLQAPTLFASALRLQPARSTTTRTPSPSRRHRAQPLLNTEGPSPSANTGQPGASSAGPQHDPPPAAAANSRTENQNAGPPAQEVMLDALPAPRLQPIYEIARQPVREIPGLYGPCFPGGSEITKGEFLGCCCAATGAAIWQTPVGPCVLGSSGAKLCGPILCTAGMAVGCEGSCSERTRAARVREIREEAQATEEEAARAAHRNQLRDQLRQQASASGSNQGFYLRTERDPTGTGERTDVPVSELP